MAKKVNPFAMFTQEVKTAHIKALDADIKYRELSIREQDELNKNMIKGYDSKTNEPEIDMNQALTGKYKKVSAMLVEPAMSVEDLLDLPTSAQEAIDEILDLLSPDEGELVDEEGN